MFLALLLVAAAWRTGAAQLAAGAAAEAAALPALPAVWPRTLELGMSDAPGGASAMRETAPFGFRYQYLAGGVRTGNGWADWNPDGSFVTRYVEDSRLSGMVPVFSYYMLLQSAPGSAQPEPEPLYANTQNVETMRAYFEDLRLFFRRAGAFPDQPVVLHVEPDLWGYLQYRAQWDNAPTVRVKVAATGLAELRDFPDDASGFARAIVALRDAYAPNVVLGYHVSPWATKTDILQQRPAEDRVRAIAERSARFYKSLGARFDITFAEFGDRDAAFKQHHSHDGGAAWWHDDDFRRQLVFLSEFVRLTQRRVVLWQIPYGNTKMRAVNNTWQHFQDNKVEWLLDDPARGNLAAYVDAGVAAFLFGRGADGPTCACDAASDGVTNPPPIGGNDRESLSADDDGGYFRERARAYYDATAFVLPERGLTGRWTFTTRAAVPVAARGTR